MLDSEEPIYGAPGYFLTASRYPVYGEGTIISLGHSNKVYADPNVAYAIDDYMTYTNSQCSCTIHGGDTSITTIGGDSGSPVTHSNVGLGIINTEGGYFARLQEALSIYDMSIVNS